MLSREEIIHISHLARIGISENEVEKYQKDLSAILDYFEQLQKLDTGNIQPIGHISGICNSFRMDKEEDFGSLGREAIANNVPASKEGYIKVKSVL